VVAPNGGIVIDTNAFFDRDEVIKSVGKAKISALRHSGGYVRLTARRLIKKVGLARKPPKQVTPTGKPSKAWLKWILEATQGIASPPGSPPYTHSNKPHTLRPAILFGWDRSSQSVVVGPSSMAIGRIGATHEHGGLEFDAPKKKRPNNWRIEQMGHGPIRIDASGGVAFAILSSPKQVERSKRLATIIAPGAMRKSNKPASRKYPARPFMRPAMNQAYPKLPSFWRDSVRA
jgi:hypothetical protein